MNQEKLNEWLNKRKEVKTIDFDKLFDEIKDGNIASLSKAITLIESSRAQDQEISQKLIQKSLPFIGQSIRIGITGVPGVGKSTFIESFGNLLIEKGKRVAVLAIDPSSEKSHGSILGDKTRMEKLSLNPAAFIRPTSAGATLGGVARRTREATYLCELAGYDVILIETVGVGQSETSVHSMVDFFMLLMLSGAGDELQGIKRGIMEMADLLVITKADGDNLLQAKKARQEYQNAMHLFPANGNNWISKSTISSVSDLNSLVNILDIIEDFQQHTTKNGYFDLNRKQQDQFWFEESLKELILNYYYQNTDFKNDLNTLKNQVLNGEISSFEAATKLFNKQQTNGEN